MTLPVAEDLPHPPEVGRYYQVKVVYVQRTIGYEPSLSRMWWPVHGAAHSDAEIEGAGVHRHYHLFVPFLSDHQLDGLRSGDGCGAEYGLVAIHANPSTEHIANTFSDEKWVRRRCRRSWTAYPYEVTGAARVRARIAYAHKPLPKDCMVCPHRGMNLAMVPPDAQGVVTCPGHGLRWHLATGAPA